MKDQKQLQHDVAQELEALTHEELKKIRVALETERNFRTGEVRELQRVAEAMEEILRLVKKDMEPKKKCN